MIESFAPMLVDIGMLCIECRQDTSFGSGRFVNRIPADNGEEDGYMCAECQFPELCFFCEKLPPEEGEILCAGCAQPSQA